MACRIQRDNGAVCFGTALASVSEMTDTPNDRLGELSGAVRESMHRFLDVYEPLRSELYRYCRYLTRSPWDAEDLAQDTLARAFVTLGRMGRAPENPRAWLFRVASNAWIDEMRRKRLPEAEAETRAWNEPRAPREAAATLIARLSPQERAAVVLKDVFDFTVEEIAETLSTTTGAVGAALHRGRRKVLAPEPEEHRVPAPGALNEFCDAFNARDLPRLTALLLDTATVEVVGVSTEYPSGKAGSGILSGMLFGSERLAEADTRGGIEARYIQGILPSPPRSEVRSLRGEALLLIWYDHTDGEAVRAINRIETEGARVCRILNYFFTPDFIADVCREIDVPYRLNGYRYWLSGC
jgi:RNA polymerase sigma-70 factor (ECF subfamily)